MSLLKESQRFISSRRPNNDKSGQEFSNKLFRQRRPGRRKDNERENRRRFKREKIPRGNLNKDRETDIIYGNERCGEVQEVTYPG